MYVRRNGDSVYTSYDRNYVTKISFHEHSLVERLHPGVVYLLLRGGGSTCNLFTVDSVG